MLLFYRCTDAVARNGKGSWYYAVELSYGVMADVHIFGKTFFDAMDFLVSNLLMPFGALCLSLFTGYIFKKAFAMEELHLDETAWKQGLFQVWLFLLRFIIPIIIIVVFIAQFM